MMSLLPQLRITRLHITIASLFIFVATVLTFVNAINADFVNWDDDVYVTDNPRVQTLSSENVSWMFSHTYYYAWIPITLISHAVDVAVWGMNSKGHHLTNVVLHAFNAVWFFLVSMLFFSLSKETEERNALSSLAGRLTTSIVLGSLIGAFLYAMHPLRVEPVAWVSGRKDLLCAFFLLPAFGSFLLWKLGRGKLALVFAHVLFALALLAKPMAAPFPIILVLVDAWWVKRRSEQSTFFDYFIKGKVLLFLFAAVVAVVTILGVAGGKVNVVEELSLVERFLLPTYAIFFYLWKTVVPLDLSPIYPDVSGAMLYIAPIVFVGIAYASLVLIGKKRNGLALAFFCYVMILLPTFLGLSSGLQPIADRYSYLSTISVFMFVGGCAEWSWRKSSTSLGRRYQSELIFAVLFVLCGINAYRTIRHVEVWNNSVSLWSQAVRYAPASREEFESRKPYIKPNYLDAYINLGAAYYAANNKVKAWEQFSAALALDSCNADAHYNLGMLLIEGGDGENAKRAFVNAVGCDPSYAKAYHNLGVLIARQDSSTSVEMFRRAARLGFPDAQITLRGRGYSW